MLQNPCFWKLSTEHLVILSIRRHSGAMAVDGELLIYMIIGSSTFIPQIDTTWDLE
jgi:hypothetical protein